MALDIRAKARRFRQAMMLGVQLGMQAVTGSNGGIISFIRESFTGAFQSNVTIDRKEGLLAFSALFSCVTTISRDVGKLPIKLTEDDGTGICTDVVWTSPYYKVLKKPNHFQTRIKFIEQWISSKLLHGNAYALKYRDARGIVTRLYILDPSRVTPMVAPDGDIFYELKADNLSGLDKEVVMVPASEIIHDTMVCLFHPLVGVSPIFACGMAATMGNKILANSATFFQNMSRPSGMLTAPGTIQNDTAARIKTEWEQNFSGGNIGRLAVLGDALKYEPMTIPAADAQLIEQLKWTVEDVARCFNMPLYKIGGALPQGLSIGAANQAYYNDCLQPLIEAAELLLDEGLGLPISYHTEFDVDNLLRMDVGARMEAWGKGIKDGWLKPDEARRKEGLAPVPGGDTPYMQQQNFALSSLAKRDALPNPFVIDKPTSNPTPSSGGPASVADPEEGDQAANDQAMASLLQHFQEGLAA